MPAQSAPTRRQKTGRSATVCGPGYSSGPAPSPRLQRLQDSQTRVRSKPTSGSPAKAQFDLRRRAYRKSIAGWIRPAGIADGRTSWEAPEIEERGKGGAGQRTGSNGG